MPHVIHTLECGEMGCSFILMSFKLQLVFDISKPTLQTLGVDAEDLGRSESVAKLRTSGLGTQGRWRVLI